MIPKKLHFVWIGDESKRPDNCINTWREKNPDYEVIIWGNETLDNYKWINFKHMLEMSKRELCGVADIMRYEILFNEGGITLDADSICLNPLEDWLLKPDAFAHWEQELVRPGLIGVAAMGSISENPFFRDCILRLYNKSLPINKRAWQLTGPQHITEVFKQASYDLTVYPSHYFIKFHFTGKSYNGNGHCFSTQLWGSTLGYDNIN
jgi:mannosyltransferase OCH1-like enzyme